MHKYLGVKNENPAGLLSTTNSPRFLVADLYPENSNMTGIPPPPLWARDLWRKKKGRRGALIDWPTKPRMQLHWRHPIFCRGPAGRWYGQFAIYYRKPKPQFPRWRIRLIEAIAAKDQDHDVYEVDEFGWLAPVVSFCRRRHGSAMPRVTRSRIARSRVARPRAIPQTTCESDLVLA